VEGITPPASAETMADGYLSVYRRRPVENAA
jgi:hypothetical protein